MPTTAPTMAPLETMPPLSTTRLTCHAPHPTTSVSGARVLCNSFMGFVPGVLLFVETATQAPAHADDGDLWIRCGNRKCRAWNRFHILRMDDDR